MRATVAGAVAALVALGIWGCPVRFGDSGREETRTITLHKPPKADKWNGTARR